MRRVLHVYPSALITESALIVQLSVAMGVFFMAMALYPHVQKKAQEELDAFRGTERLPDGPKQRYFAVWKAAYFVHKAWGVEEDPPSTRISNFERGCAMLYTRVSEIDTLNKKSKYSRSDIHQLVFST